MSDTPHRDDDFVVDSRPVVAKNANVSLSTVDRAIKAGRLKVTHLSERRRGIQRRHYREWLGSGTST